MNADPKNVFPKADADDGPVIEFRVVVHRNVEEALKICTGGRTGLLFQQLHSKPGVQESTKKTKQQLDNFKYVTEVLNDEWKAASKQERVKIARGSQYMIHKIINHVKEYEYDQPKETRRLDNILERIIIS